MVALNRDIMIRTLRCSLLELSSPGRARWL